MAYREYVQEQANGQQPSPIFLNRTAVHAAVVMEFIFRTAQNLVQILTHTLMREVYGNTLVSDAAWDLLERNPLAVIDILAETAIDRATHPFFARIDQDQAKASRVTLRYVPESVRGAYPFNFAVADSQHYRFEESRASQEAFVQFGAQEFASNLASTFAQLSTSASDRPA